MAADLFACVRYGVLGLARGRLDDFCAKQLGAATEWTVCRVSGMTVCGEPFDSRGTAADALAVVASACTRTPAFACAIDEFLHSCEAVEDGQQVEGNHLYYFSKFWGCGLQPERLDIGWRLVGRDFGDHFFHFLLIQW